MFENQDDINLALNNLEHAGVKGMKWGVRRKARNAAIKEARSRQWKKQGDILKTAAKLPFAERGPGKAEAKKLIDKVGKFYTDGDRKMAAKRTTGEKVAISLLATGAIAGAIISSQ